jgi:hypothetical protein
MIKVCKSNEKGELMETAITNKSWRADVLDAAGETLLEMNLPAPNGDTVFLKATPEWIAEFMRLVRTQSNFFGVAGMDLFLQREDMCEDVAHLLRNYVCDAVRQRFQAQAEQVRWDHITKRDMVIAAKSRAVTGLQAAIDFHTMCNDQAGVECLRKEAAAIDSKAGLIQAELDGRIKLINVKQFGRDGLNFLLERCAAIIQHKIGQQLPAHKVIYLLAKLLLAAQVANKNKIVKFKSPAATKKLIQHLLDHSSWKAAVSRR